MEFSTAETDNCPRRLVIERTTIRPMKWLVVAIAAPITLSCFPSMEPDHVKTPDEIVDEQVRIGAAHEREVEKQGGAPEVDPIELTDDEEKRLWDEKYAVLELQRASHSAETCPEVVTKDKKVPKGRARVTLLFGNDGHVKNATVAPPYADTVVGTCVLRAMGAVIVKNYVGPEKTVEWEIDLTGAAEKTSGPAGGSAEK